MTKPYRSENPHGAGLYRAMALRFYSRYVDMRGHAAFAGGDLPDHSPLPTEADRCKKPSGNGCSKRLPRMTRCSPSWNLPASLPLTGLWARSRATP